MTDRKYTVVLIDGGRYDPWSPEGDAPSPETIAWGLANLNRYGGHTTRPLSVAEHSIWVALCIACGGHDNLEFRSIAEQFGHGSIEGALNKLPENHARNALLGLCHDAAEAAGLVDVPSPVGRHMAMQDYKDAHDRCATWLCTFWGIQPPPWPAIIKETDHSVLGAESKIRPHLKLPREELVPPWPNLDLAGPHDLSKHGTAFVREAWISTFYALKAAIAQQDTPSEETQVRRSVAKNIPDTK